MKKLLHILGLFMIVLIHPVAAQTVQFTLSSGETNLSVPSPGGLTNVQFNVNVTKPEKAVLSGYVRIYASGSTSALFESAKINSGDWNGGTSVTVPNSFNIFPENLGSSGSGNVYAQFEDDGGSKYKSNTISAKVVTAIANNTISTTGTVVFFGSGDPSVINGTKPTGGDGTSYTYQWQLSTTSASTGFTAISGATSQNYDPSTITKTTWYRRIARSAGLSNNSNVVAITISVEPLGNNSITNTGSASFADSGDPGLLTGSTPTGGAGSYTYQWQYATLANPSSFADISGATAQSYDPPVTEITRYFRRKVTSGTEVNYSNVITINIIRTGATISNPINIGDIGLCTEYSRTYTNFPEYGYGNEWGNSTDDIFHKFNLTVPAKIWLGNCKSDGVSGSIALLDASGNFVTASATDPCDAGTDFIYNLLQPGVYYIVSEGTGYQYETNYLPIALRIKPVFTTSPNVTIAAGESTTLQATGSGLTYRWGPSAGLNTTSGATVVATPAVTTTYAVSGVAPAGCTDTQYITVTVIGSAGSTFANPITANFSGCQYNSPAIDPKDYGNDYGGWANDVFYKFTITSATQVTIGPYWAIDTQEFELLNSSGGVITHFRYIYPSPDFAASDAVQLADPASFTVSLSAGTYYLMVEGTYQNAVLGPFIRLANCRVATADASGEINTTSVENAVDIDMFPNPTKNDVTFSFQQEGPATIHFVNNNGLNVKQAKIEGNSQTVNTSDLSPGLYLLRIIQGNTVYTRKLRIEER